MKRVIVDYAKLTNEILNLLVEKFPDNERMQDILIKAVDKRLSNVIDTAQNFLLELNEDIKLLNKIKTLPKIFFQLK